MAIYTEDCGCAHDGRAWVRYCAEHGREASDRRERAKNDRAAAREREARERARREALDLIS